MSDDILLNDDILTVEDLKKHFRHWSKGHIQARTHYS